MQKEIGLYLIVVFQGCMRYAVAQAQSTLTVQIPAGRIECFYHTATHNVPFELEYQVISGGELDINLAVRNPNAQIVIQEHKKNDNLHRFDAAIPGEYQICFDNSFSTFQPKLVFFEVFEDRKETHAAEFHQLGINGQMPVDAVGLKVDDLQNSLGKVHLNLEKVVKSQTVVRHFEAVDRVILESNFDKVNTYSGIQTAVMVIVGVVQVVMVRSLFEERSKIGRVLRGNQARTFT